MFSEQVKLSEPEQNSSPDIVRRDKNFGVVMGSIGAIMVYAASVNEILWAQVIAGATGLGFLLAGGYSFLLHKKRKN